MRWRSRHFVASPAFLQNYCGNFRAGIHSGWCWVWIDNDCSSV